MKLFSLELLLGTECKFQSFVSRTVRLEAVPQMCCGALLAHQGSREHHPACATEWLFSMCSRILHRELNFQVSERQCVDQELIYRISLWFAVAEKVRQNNAGELPNRKAKLFSTDKTPKPTTLPVNGMNWESLYALRSVAWSNPHSSILSHASQSGTIQAAAGAVGALCCPQAMLRQEGWCCCPWQLCASSDQQSHISAERKSRQIFTTSKFSSLQNVVWKLFLQW